MPSFLMIPNHPVLSILLWIVLGLLLLYIGRKQARQTILAASRVVANALRLSARSVMLAEARLRQRNREVLLAAGAEDVEREMEREFHRIEAVVSRDLQRYPAFHRAMSDLISRVDEDYSRSTESPPSPPAWTRAVEVVATLPDQGDNKMVASILKEIHKTIEKQHKEAMDEYRKSSSRRHSLLQKMIPTLRKLGNSVGDAQKTITGLFERAAIIDRRMAEYEEIRVGTDKVVRKLSSSSMTQFFIAGLVMVIAIGGAVINFNLIALPMSEMVGGGSYIGPYKTSNVAALVIILVEVAMGLFLMESLRITRLFPIIGLMDDKMRNRMLWVSFTILLLLAGVESALAFMRDRIAADMEALRQTLAGVEVIAPPNSWIPTVGQMVLGFILPFALTFVAIPLETFIHSSRTVFGTLCLGILQAVAYLLRLAASLTFHLGKMLITVYDLAIFPLLWLEEQITSRGRKTNGESPADDADLSENYPQEAS